MPDFHRVMQDKEKIREMSSTASEYCSDKFDRTENIAACRVGVHRISQSLIDQLEEDDPRIVEGHGNPSESVHSLTI